MNAVEICSSIRSQNLDLARTDNANPRPSAVAEFKGLLQKLHKTDVILAAKMFNGQSSWHLAEDRALKAATCGGRKTLRREDSQSFHTQSGEGPAKVLLQSDGGCSTKLANRLENNLPERNTGQRGRHRELVEASEVHCHRRRRRLPTNTPAAAKGERNTSQILFRKIQRLSSIPTNGCSQPLRRETQQEDGDTDSAFPTAGSQWKRARS